MNSSFAPGYTTLFEEQLRKENIGLEFEVKSFHGNTGTHRWAEINGIEVSENVLSAIFDSGKDGIYKIEASKVGKAQREEKEKLAKEQDDVERISQMYQN